MDVGKNGPDMGPKHAPPFEFRSGQYLDYLEKFWHCALTRKKNLKNLKKLGRKFTRGKLGQWLYTRTILKFTQMLQKPLNGRHSG